PAAPQPAANQPPAPPVAGAPAANPPSASAPPTAPKFPWEVPDGGKPFSQTLPAVIGPSTPAYQSWLLLPGARSEFLGNRVDGNPVGIVRGRVEAETGKLEEFGVLDGVAADRANLWGETRLPPYPDLDEQGRLALYVRAAASSSLEGEIRI